MVDWDNAKFRCPVQTAFSAFFELLNKEKQREIHRGDTAIMGNQEMALNLVGAKHRQISIYILTKTKISCLSQDITTYQYLISE